MLDRIYPSHPPAAYLPSYIYRLRARLLPLDNKAGLDLLTGVCRASVYYSGGRTILDTIYLSRPPAAYVRSYIYRIRPRLLLPVDKAGLDLR